MKSGKPSRSPASDFRLRCVGGGALQLYAVAGLPEVVWLAAVPKYRRSAQVALAPLHAKQLARALDYFVQESDPETRRGPGRITPRPSCAICGRKIRGLQKILPSRGGGIKLAHARCLAKGGRA